MDGMKVLLTVMESGFMQVEVEVQVEEVKLCCEGKVLRSFLEEGFCRL